MQLGRGLPKDKLANLLTAPPESQLLRSTIKGTRGGWPVEISRLLRPGQSLFYVGNEGQSMTRTIVSKEGSVLLPKRVRERLNLDAGTELSIDVQGDALVMKRVPPDYRDWRSMEGMAHAGDSLTEALMEERAMEKASDDARPQGR